MSSNTPPTNTTQLANPAATTLAPTVGSPNRAPQRTKTTMLDPLPLDWTRLSSRKRAAACCVGVCRHRPRARSEAPLPPQRVQTYRGQVIACLLDSNPNWFQAYFFHELHTPGVGADVWGLLGTQKDVDECLQCSEGGYRLIDLKITSQNMKHTFVDIEWTGGDMMTLQGSGVSLQADKILTGTAAVPVLEGLFASLMRRVHSEFEKKNEIQGDIHESNDSDIDMLEIFPELLIVVGQMELGIPLPTDNDG